MVYFIGTVFVIVLLGGWLMYRWQYSVADSVLQEWAQQQHATVLEKTVENDWYSGPSNRAATNKQIVYRIRIREQAGRERSGLARIGSKSIGMLERRIDVQLDP